MESSKSPTLHVSPVHIASPTMEETGGAAAPSPTTTVTTGNNEVEVGGSDNIKIKVSYGSNNFDVFTTPQSTFGDLKRLIAEATGLDPKVQKVLFRGKEKDDQVSLQMAGVKDNAKVIVMDNSPSQDEDIGKLQHVEENIKEISRGLEAVNVVKQENDHFAEQVASLETVVGSGTQIADKDFVFLTEMLMRQLLKLDEIVAEGEGRTQRKLEVRRVQELVEKLDNLRAKNSNLTSNVPEKGEEPSLPSSSKEPQRGASGEQEQFQQSSEVMSWCDHCHSRYTRNCTKDTMRCVRCGKKGHGVKECTFQQNVCYKCHKPGHRQAKCPTKTETGGGGSTSGQQRGNQPRAKGRACQMTIQES